MDEPELKQLVVVRIIQTNGLEHVLSLDRKTWFKETEKLIDSDVFDMVRLRDRMVMLVDDEGYAKEKPVNSRATEIYHAVYRTDWPIVGDVAIVKLKDLEDDD